MAQRDEDDLLKSVALQNAQTILAARQQAEQALIQAKDALAEEREWLRTVLSSIGDAVITADIKGKVTFLNSQAELLTGWGSSEALGQPLESVFNIVDGKTRKTVSNRIINLLHDGITAAQARHSILLARNGTEAAIEDSATPVRNGAGTVFGVVLVFRDIAESTRTN